MVKNTELAYLNDRNQDEYINLYCDRSGNSVTPGKCRHCWQITGKLENHLLKCEIFYEKIAKNDCTILK
jgi:hypothetical protein